MKIKKKAAIAAAVFVAAMNFSACAYGPPNGEWDTETTEESESGESFDPGDNYNVTVYGPPESEWYNAEMPEESGADENSDMTVDTNENSEVNADE